MQKVIAFLALVGFAQALNVLQEDDDLHIKMPEPITPDEKSVKEVPTVGLSLVQSESKLDMFEMGILHASMKAIVNAKVKKTMNYIRHTKSEYEQGNVDQRMAIQDKAHALALDGQGTRDYNKELCWSLWGEQSQLASTLSFYYCPSLIYPVQSRRDKIIDVTKWAGKPESRVRSAELTWYLWNCVLYSTVSGVVAFLDPSVTYSTSHNYMVAGKDRVAKILPFIGFPDGSFLTNSVEWHCNLEACIAPIQAWAAQKNFVYSKYSSKGQALEVIVPLKLWR